MNETIGASRVCPWCGCTDTHKSHRRGLIDRGLVRLLRISPYRCDDCDRRFYARECSRRETSDRQVVVG
jgi:transposase-like protein